MQFITLLFLVALGLGRSPIAPVSTVVATRTIPVATSDALQRALLAAQPGDVIQLDDGVYTGTFTVNVDGTARAPITLQGTRQAILDGGSVQDGYALHLQADYWVLRGFTVTRAEKGIMADGANYNLLDGLNLFNIEHEAVHFRAFSTHNTIQNCTISHTGLSKAGFGEGVYLGSAKSNWAKYSHGAPDTSDANRVLNNHFGPNVRAEAIDIKEGTSGGEIRGNVFDGTGMSGANFADSWVDVKGNSYTISENRGTQALRDGFQTHQVLAGWGRSNVFRGNTANVQASGYGIYIQLDKHDAAGNVVYSDNRATHAGAGLTNVSVTAGSGPTPSAAPARTPTPVASQTALPRSTTTPHPTTPAPQPTGTCHVAFEFTEVWQTGFTAQVTISNTGPAINGWTLTWNFADGQTVLRAWNATVTQYGSAVMATNATWNATLAPRASASFGIKGTHQGRNALPKMFRLNNIACV